ncbi:MAG: ATP-dependent zinc metalloprotease FtsH [Magnetospirillum sp.]|nr:ATP-dependent zinc metalloprotease FtsH [Magnetospirillum sp.]
MSRRKYLLIALLALLGLVLVGAVSYPLYRGLTADNGPGAVKESSYSAVRARIADGNVTDLTFYADGTAVAKARGDGALSAAVPPSVAAKLADEAAGKGAKVVFEPDKAFSAGTGLGSETALAVVGNIIVLGAVAFGLWFFRLRAPVGGGSRATLASPADTAVRFADVAGCDNEKLELMEVVEFLKNPSRFSRLGARVPTGVLMSGPPGTGKTMLARAVAGEAGVPFFSISGSDFVEMFVGVGAGRVRKMFATAKKKAPCILFIDEIDAVGRQRSGANARAAHEEREQTLNQLLVEMDGFKPNSGVVVIAATNRPDILDEALLRPGRFSRHVVLQTPDVAGREKILGVHAAKVRLSPKVDLHLVARGTPGFSGAQLAHLVNEAAIVAARAGHDKVTMADFDAAKDRILLGTERQTIMSEEDRRLTAYHEAGHAVVALHMPASDPIHKATIVPRGQALGMVVRLPEKDSPALRRSKLEADLAVAMGGRAAEELIFGHDDVSTGAAGDIQMATRIARKMVTEWGMSADLGMVAFAGAHADPYTAEGMRSDETSRKIDTEVRKLTSLAHRKALAVLETHAAQLEAVAQALLERESLSGTEINEIIRTSRLASDLENAAFTAG